MEEVVLRTFIQVHVPVQHYKNTTTSEIPEFKNLLKCKYKHISANTNY